MTLTEFLLARIAEDEAVARDDVQALEGWADDSPDLDAAALLWHARRALRECEAKRRMIDFIITQAGQVDGEWGDNCSDDELRDGKCSDHGSYVAREGLWILASVYSDHPDYQPEWRPTD